MVHFGLATCCMKIIGTCVRQGTLFIVDLPLPYIPPGQDIEMFSVPDQGVHSSQQLHPYSQKQRAIPRTHRALFLPPFQTYTFQILCGPFGHCCRGNDLEIA